MSWFHPSLVLEDIPLEKIQAEVARREQALTEGRCPYCKRPVGTHPVCKHADQHFAAKRFSGKCVSWCGCQGDDPECPVHGDFMTACSKHHLPCNTPHPTRTSVQGCAKCFKEES